MHGQADHQRVVSQVPFGECVAEPSQRHPQTTHHAGSWTRAESRTGDRNCSVVNVQKAFRLPEQSLGLLLRGCIMTLDSQRMRRLHALLRLDFLLAQGEMNGSLPSVYMAMAQNPESPVNIPIPTKIGASTPKWYPQPAESNGRSTTTANACGTDTSRWQSKSSKLTCFSKSSPAQAVQHQGHPT